MLEIVFTSLMVIAVLAGGWFAVFVVYKLFKGQS